MIARCEEYLDYIRGTSCSVPRCDDGSIAHHVFPGGTAIKGSDFATIPLCWKHHEELHNTGVKTFADKYNLRYAEVILDNLIPYLDQYPLQRNESQAS